MSRTTAKALERTITSLKLCDDGHESGAGSHTAAKERATSRFAAAQKLFEDQAASQLNTHTPGPLIRQRTNTTASLYAKLNHPAPEFISSPFLEGRVPVPDNGSLTNVAMSSKAWHVPKLDLASALALSSSLSSPVDTGSMPGLAVVRQLGTAGTINLLYLTAWMKAIARQGWLREAREG
ncbi:uncharacterized protein PV09_01079 [Verruconis gallopava]|uniref:Uncharacterized protein n=1 Tax=Verruconis gallopava TaxID=253628 RepID=A0A0D1Z589_9PEZI|nr:uncharacterized protein PV09_01079 [Verruconis gallopava]KIW08147.1 hypothetical protein PV09_01079 [Verruconis gallopava]